MPNNIAIICFDFCSQNIRKQPWHSVYGIAKGLKESGYNATIITDSGYDSSDIQDVEIIHVSSLRQNGKPSDEILSKLEWLKTDLVIFVSGSHELIFPNRFKLKIPVYLLICNQRFKLEEIFRIKPRDFLNEFRLLALPLIASLIPSIIMRYGFRASHASGLLYLSEDANRRYFKCGLPNGTVIKPRVEQYMTSSTSVKNEGEKTLCYFGPPLCVRGADLCVKAFNELRSQGIKIKLKMLIRLDDDFSQAMNEHLLEKIRATEFGSEIEYIEHKLSKQDLADELARSDIFLLPFRITVSDVPLVVIEAGLSGKPVITLDTGGVTDIASEMPSVYAAREVNFAKAIRTALTKESERFIPDAKRWFDWKESVQSFIKNIEQRNHFDIFRMIALTGVDGSGKSTLCRELQKVLASYRIPNVYKWSRFRNYLSKPLLFITRFTGHNEKKVVNGVKMGFHHFSKNPLLAYSFLALQWIDNFIDIMLRYRLASYTKNSLIVSDRSIIDTLIDLVIDTGKKDFITGIYGRSLIAILPKPNLILHIKRDRQSITHSRPDVTSDPNFDQRIELYSELARKFDLKIIDNEGSLEQTINKIMALK